MTNSERIKLSMAIGMLQIGEVGKDEYEMLAAIKNTLVLLKSLELETREEALKQWQESKTLDRN